MGRCFRRIRLNDDLARHAGINVFRYKLASFAIGSVLAAVAGGLYGYYTRLLDPGFLSIDQSLEGAGDGAAGRPGHAHRAGRGLARPRRPAARDRPSAEVRSILYSAILIFTILVMPRGVVGTLLRWRAKRGS